MWGRFRIFRKWVVTRLTTPGSYNWKVVTLCFVGATIFWFFNSLGKEYTTRVNYPIEFLYSLEGTQVVGHLPRSIELNVTGGGWTLLQHSLNPGQFPPISIFLENPTTTKYLVRDELRTLATEALTGFTLNLVLTDTIKFNIEPIDTRAVVIAVDEQALEYDDDYRRTGPIVVEPNILEVTGPESVLDELPDTLSFALEVGSIDETIEEQVEVDFLPSPYLSTTHEEVQVTFPVAEFITFNRQVSVELRNFPTDNSVYLADSLVSVTYSVPLDQEERYDSLTIQAVVDYYSIGVGDTLVMPDLLLKQSPEPVPTLYPLPLRIFRATHE